MSERAVSEQNEYVSYNVGGPRDILVPLGHNLPSYQKQHPLYDRFLPKLCAVLPNKTELIIDIGANIGDTVCSISPMCDNPILCVEGYHKYFDLLAMNVSTLPNARNVEVVQSIVGTGRFGGTLIDDGTTATLALGTDAGQSITLDALLSRHHGDELPVCLLKVDTDGFDADVIASGEGLIRRYEPLIFWENYFSDAGQRAFLDDIYRDLESWGYDVITIFDNFGNLLAETSTFKELASLNSYIYRQDKGQGSRTLWYTDVIASTQSRRSTHIDAISKFKTDYLLSS